MPRLRRRSPRRQRLRRWTNLLQVRALSCPSSPWRQASRSRSHWRWRFGASLFTDARQARLQPPRPDSDRNPSPIRKARLPSLRQEGAVPFFLSHASPSSNGHGTLAPPYRFGILTRTPPRLCAPSASTGRQGRRTRRGEGGVLTRRAGVMWLRRRATSTILYGHGTLAPPAKAGVPYPYVAPYGIRREQHGNN